MGVQFTVANFPLTLPTISSVSLFNFLYSGTSDLEGTVSITSRTFSKYSGCLIKNTSKAFILLITPLV